jgi:hypothetical protein
VIAPKIRSRLPAGKQGIAVTALPQQKRDHYQRMEGLMDVRYVDMKNQNPFIF